MCSVQHSPSKETMERMYSMNGTLNEERNMPGPKKDNIFRSVLNTMNVIWEQVSKVHSSVIAGINYPLSVTVVHNEGIIPQDFFKNLTTNKESKADNVYIQDASVKEPLNIVDSIHYGMLGEKKPYTNRIFDENITESLNFSFKYVKTENKDTERSDRNESVKKNVCNDTTNCNILIPLEDSNKQIKEELFEPVWTDIDTEEMYIIKNISYCKGRYEQSISNKDKLSDSIPNSTDDKTVKNVEPSFSTSNSNTVDTHSSKQTTVSNLLTNMWQKVVDSVTDRFCKTDSMESDVTMKRSFSPKQRRKHNTIAKGRGRGRGRLQLRRSGVSQTRHRKERTKHDLEEDIQNDLKSWLEFDIYHTVQSKRLGDCCSLDEDMVDGIDTTDYVVQEAVHPIAYTFADIKPKVQKPKARKIVDQGVCTFSARMRSIPEYAEELNAFHQDFIDNRYNSHKNTFRPRLVSESSIDSEDSYCIVFETSSEANFKSDFEDSDESDVDQSSEDEDMCKDEEFVSSVQKVKFNLNPVVHVMVQWDYAYRAARRGPWEEMARDRERFKGRINCIERVLNPILTVQHRTHIWQERFANNK